MGPVARYPLPGERLPNRHQLMTGCLNGKSSRSTRCCEKLNSALKLIQRTTTEAPQRRYVLLGLDVYKKTISYCVKDAAGHVLREGKIRSALRRTLRYRNLVLRQMDR